MMGTPLAHACLPPLIGILIGIGVAMLPGSRWHRRAPVASVHGRGTVGASVTMVLGMVPVVATLVDPRLFGWSFAVLSPLLSGVVGLLVCCLPRRMAEGVGTVDLERRMVTSFASRRLLALPALVLAAILAVTIPAGVASQPDENGRYTQYVVDLGSLQIGTTIYGWAYSVPALALIALILVLVAMSLRATARPPRLPDREADARTRRQHMCFVVFLATGALLIHLQKVLVSLSGTARLTGGAQGEDGWWFEGGPPFAILAAPFEFLSLIAGVAGWALWSAALVATVTAGVAYARRTEPAWHD